VNRCSSDYRAAFNLGAGVGHNVRRYDLNRHLGHIATLVKQCGASWNGPEVVLFVRGGQLKRVQKYYEAPLERLLPALRTAFEAPAVLKALAAGLSQYPVVRSSYECQQAGPAGVLSAKLYSREAGAQEFVRRFPDLCITQDAQALHAARLAAGTGDGLRADIQGIAMLVPSLMQKVCSKVKVETAEAIAERARSQYPAAAYMRTEELFGASVEALEAALPMLEAVFGPSVPPAVVAQPLAA